MLKPRGRMLAVIEWRLILSVIVELLIPVPILVLSSLVTSRYLVVSYGLPWPTYMPTCLEAYSIKNCDGTMRGRM